MQTTIPFVIRKKCNFYGLKEDIVKEDFSEATARFTSSKYTPVVKKIVTLSSSESDSDSDIENVMEKREKQIDKIIKTSRNVRKHDESDGWSYSDYI